MKFGESLNEAIPEGHFQKTNGRHIVLNARKDVLLSKSPDSDICYQQKSTVKQTHEIREL